MSCNVRCFPIDGPRKIPLGGPPQAVVRRVWKLPLNDARGYARRVELMNAQAKALGHPELTSSQTSTKDSRGKSYESTQR
jgi:hypothetical protein